MKLLLCVTATVLTSFWCWGTVWARPPCRPFWTCMRSESPSSGPEDEEEKRNGWDRTVVTVETASVYSSDVPAGSVWLRRRISRSFPSGAYWQRGTPSGPLCLSDYQPPPVKQTQANREDKWKKEKKTSYFVYLLYGFKWWKNDLQLTWQ